MARIETACLATSSSVFTRKGHGNKSYAIETRPLDLACVLQNHAPLAVRKDRLSLGRKSTTSPSWSGAGRSCLQKRENPETAHTTAGRGQREENNNTEHAVREYNERRAGGGRHPIDTDKRSVHKKS